MTTRAVPAAAAVPALAVIGLDGTAELVYRELLSEPALPESDLADRIGVSRLDVQRAVSDLLDAGLLIRSQSGLGAVPPQLALTTALDRRARELIDARSTIDVLQDEYLQGNPGHGTDESIEVVVGEQAVQACHVRALLSARSMVRVLRGRGALAAAVLAGDAAVRLLVAENVLEDPRQGADLRGARREGLHLRSLRGSHESLVVVDDRLALLPAGPLVPGAGCLYVTNLGLVHAVTQLFDALWDGSWELTVSGSGDQPVTLDDADRQLLAFVVAGLKDESIARQLGVGCRTVQRRLSAMSRRLGARNRLELVRTAMERGLT